MATISLRVEDEIRDALEDRASGEDVSVSELIRQAIESLLGRDVQLNWSAPSSLPKRDRLQLSLLHRIVQMLESDEFEADYHGSMIDVLRHGYTGEYGEEFISISDELSLSDCKLVWDILDMFRMIKASVDHLGIEKIRALDERAEHALTFRGFDLNDSLEGRMLGYAVHLIEHDRWQGLAEHFDDLHEGGNSHAPMLETYKRMLDVYRPIWADIIDGHKPGRDRDTITKEELASLAQAWYYPR